jgi:hypothetical protein
MSVIERPERAPDRMWRCPNCGRPCGRAGHITERCDGKSIEYVRADIHRGAVEALRGIAERTDVPADFANAVVRLRWVHERATNALGGQ